MGLNTVADQLWAAAFLILPVLGSWAGCALWRKRHADTDPVEDPTEEHEVRVIFAAIDVPTVVSGDGSPVQPCQLAAVSVMVARQVAVLAQGLHAEVMAEVVAQVAAAEARDLDEKWWAAS